MTHIRPRHEHRRIVLVLDQLERLGIDLADADSEDDAAYRRARRKLWRLFIKAVEERAQARPVHRRKTA